MVLIFIHITLLMYISLYFFIDCMGVKPRLTANFVQKFAKKYLRLVGDVTFQGESDLQLIAVDTCQRQKRDPNYKFGFFFLQLTFWFDCGGRTGCQMGSVFDALWVEYS